jgi:hypothetical protein
MKVAKIVLRPTNDPDGMIIEPVELYAEVIGIRNFKGHIEYKLSHIPNIFTIDQEWESVPDSMSIEIYTNRPKVILTGDFIEDGTVCGMEFEIKDLEFYDDYPEQLFNFHYGVR